VTASPRKKTIRLREERDQARRAAAEFQQRLAAAEQRQQGLMYDLARHITGAYVSGNDNQVRRARELETSLDQRGFNVDNRVDRLVLDQMRRPPSDRGTDGRPDTCPF
jgi:hypothetical protein